MIAGNDGSSEISSRNLVLGEEDVELLERAAAHFGQPEVTPDEHKKREATREKAGLASPIGSGRLQNIWRNDLVDDVQNHVHHSSKGNRLRSESRRGSLADNNVRHRSDGEAKVGIPDQVHCRDGEADSLG